jgi:hypothetical protein
MSRPVEIVLSNKQSIQFYVYMNPILIAVQSPSLIKGDSCGEISKAKKSPNCLDPWEHSHLINTLEKTLIYIYIYIYIYTRGDPKISGIVTKIYLKY